MTNPGWTRAHDKWIAEKCEQLEVEPNPLNLDPSSTRPPGLGFGWLPLASYNLDPAACIRAAEAWRKQLDGRRYWEMWVSLEGVPMGCVEQFTEDGTDIELDETEDGDAPAAALAWALYRATGGTE